MTIANLKLGPEGYSKIAILGTALSMSLAPFKDKNWAIWACSPGAYPICAQNRSDVWFEPHRWQPTPPGLLGAPGTKPWFSPEFHAFLAEHKGPVFMTEVQPSIPSSVRIPYEELVAKFSPYFFSSTVAYMLAIAIEALADRAARGEEVAIGLWGVDMATTDEWQYQRPSCQHFVGLAMSMGIHVVLPQESDLMRPSCMYGIGEHTDRHIRLTARLREAEAAKSNLAQQYAQIAAKMNSLDGQINELKYFIDLWADDVRCDIRQAISFAGEYGKTKIGTASNEKTTGAEVLPLEAKTG